MKILSQTCSSSACERNWRTFSLIHTKQRNRLAYERFEKLVFCYYNMRLRVRDMEAERDNAAELKPLNLLDISIEIGEENENPLYEWIRPSHMDGPDGESDPKVAKEAQNLGIDVDRVIAEEVLSSEDENKLGAF